MIRAQLLFCGVMLVAIPAVSQIDTPAWNGLLQSAVKDGQVDYALWRDNPRFDALVEQIAASATRPMNREQKLAFYINAYNILAAKGILNGGSPDGVVGRFFYFKRDTYIVAGQRISLHELEHEWLRPLKEPRIHFAIVCASQSCPILQDTAFTAAQLDGQLETATLGFIGDPSRNRFDTVSGKAELSMIFKWFAEDFEEHSGSVQAYLATFVADPAIAKRLSLGDFRISYLKYDWALNGKL